MKLIKLQYLILFLIFTGCSSYAFNDDGDDFTYKSYDPSGNYRGEQGYESVNNVTNNTSSTTTDTGTPDEVEREITEADIIREIDGRLFLLSAYRGLVIVDITNPADMVIVGRYELTGTPFEMYVEEGIAWVIFNSFWSWNFDEETGYYRWVNSSQTVALDVSNPSEITEMASYSLGGEISDSRKVGDIIYFVANENGYCWNCTSYPRITVTSVNATPDSVSLVDQLEFTGDGYNWDNSSIYVNQDRIYVAENQWSSGTSSIHVVDISDPTGTMLHGTSFALSGLIQNRWQMDEYNGVFRTISQPGFWGSDVPPVVETFQINDADSIVTGGVLHMELPRPENLMSVRFDGERAYAVTYERTDPLFTIDFSSPLQPVQRGELEIPGWLYHMEPRGNRLIALGYDDTDTNLLAMSLFDVSDLDNPVMLSRQNFGAQWSWMVEDQDRIHKALKILDSEGLILMPWAGWNSTGYESGVQIFQFNDQEIIKRGNAPHHGMARRAFISGGRLFAMSDERLDSFDIDNLSEPQVQDSLVFARVAHKFTEFGDSMLAVLSMDWWENSARINIFHQDDPDAIEPVSSINLREVLPDDSDMESWWGGFDYYNSRMFTNGDYIYFLYSSYPYWWYYESENQQDKTRLVVIDISVPEEPQIESITSFDFPMPASTTYMYGYVQSGETAVMSNQMLAMIKGSSYYWYSDTDRGIVFVDVSDPETPYIAYESDSDEDETPVALFSTGENIYVNVMKKLAIPGFSAWFMDEYSTDTVEKLAHINIPGSMIGYSGELSRIVTIDYQLGMNPGNSWSDCDTSYWEYWYSEGVCYHVDRILKILRRQSNIAIPLKNITFGGGYINSAQVTESNIFLLRNTGYYWWYDGDNTDYRPRLINVPLSGSMNPVEMATMSTWYGILAHAKGDRALVIDNNPPEIFLYETGNAEPVVQSLLTGYSWDAIFDDNKIISANSWHGMQVIDIQ
ncbi:MAG: beta-propeller domain-containing protein [Deltaproteobacteria bacterium]|nr:beta-propeller domain-containing protein [Deltaproteobacteria bacterium]